MKDRKPLIDEDGEVRELTAEDMEQFRPVQEVLSIDLLRKAGVRGPQKTPTKDRINIRLSHEVVEYFRASGPGWQGRINEVLREWVKGHQSM